MYQAVHVDTFNKISYIRDDKEGWIKEEYKPYAFKIDPNGQYTGLFGDKFRKVYSKNYVKGDLTVHEQDLNATLRVLSDRYLHEDEPPSFHKVCYFDIETEINGTLNRTNIKKANNKITSIAMLDKYNDKLYCLILNPQQTIENKVEGNKIVKSYKTEKLLLLDFLKIWEEISPTVIVGYNSCFFDCPYLYYRISKVLNKKEASRLSPIGIVQEQEWSEESPVKFCGISSLDYMRLYKKFVPKVQPSYKLDYICKKEIKEGKLHFTGSLDRLFKEDPNKYIEYNANDVLLLDKLDKKKGFIDLAIAICHFAHTEYENIYFSSLVLDGVIFTFLKRRGIVSPNKPQTNNPSLKRDRSIKRTKEEEEEDGFKGAYVKEPQIGLHDWLTDCDLKALYPSIIRTLNIGVETIVGRIVDTSLSYKESLGVDYLTKNKLEDFGSMLTIELKDGSTKRIKTSNLLSQIDSKTLSISANGILFKTDKKSVIHEVLAEWTQKRDDYKNLMKDARRALDFDKADFYDRYQQVFKVFCNSIYGVLGLTSFRYSDERKWLASATTMSGQHIIKHSIDFANNGVNKELGTKDVDYVVASDTDSFFLKLYDIVSHRLNHTITLKDSDKIIPIVEEYAETLCQTLNKEYDTLCKNSFNVTEHQISIKPEFVIEKAYWSKKKKYALKLIRREGTPIKEDEKYDFKGLDLMKSNFAPMFASFSYDMIISVLEGATKDDVDNKIIELKKKILNGTYREVATPVGIKQPLEKYIKSEAPNGQIFSSIEKGATVNFKSSIYYNDLLKFHGKEKEYPQLRIGESVAYCYLVQNPYKIECLGVPADDDYPEEIDELLTKYVDKNKNFDNQLLGKLQTFYDTLGWGIISTNTNKFSSRWNRKKVA